jgi:uncharacterized protein YecE (DUF72 family)
MKFRARPRTGNPGLDHPGVDGSFSLMQQTSLFKPPPRDISVRVGPAGWDYKDWQGTVYPPIAGRSLDGLAFLADYFDTIEINSSFYRPPRAEDATAWMRRVQNNPRFKFTAKAWQLLSHERKDVSDVSLGWECDEVRRSMDVLAGAGMLGGLLIQFPWSFRHSSENLEYLAKLFRYLSDLPLAVEVRHAEWNQDEFYAFLTEHGVAVCNVDQPVIGDSIRPAARVTSRLGYFRLHGRNYQNWFKENAGRDARYDYLYPKQEIEQVTGFIRGIKERADETYAITNNHFRGQSLAAALDILEELDGRPPAVPPQLAATYPHLMRLL